MYGLLVAQAILLSSTTPLVEAASEAKKAFGEFTVQAGQLTTMQKAVLTETDQRIAALEAAVKKVAAVADNAERVSANALLFALCMAFALGLSGGPLLLKLVRLF